MAGSLEITEKAPQQSTIIACVSPEKRLAEAYRMAAAALCTSSGKRPCGVCRDCRKVQQRIHPDVTLVTRQDKKKELIVDQVREITREAYILPNEAERRVFILEEADLMNISAQNAALKLLEEPPAGVVFLLCTVNPMQLLPTVRSRCAQIGTAGHEDGSAEELNEAAVGYLKAVAGGDTAQLMRWCTTHEDMDGAAAQEFTRSVKQLLADMLCGKQKSRKLSRADMVRLCTLMDHCGEMLKVNTGVKHIIGLLAVDSIADSGNRGKTN